MSVLVTATTWVDGLHHWPDAPAHRDYLRYPHRHVFEVAATVAVTHEAREVEFHDLADRVRLGLEDLSTSYHRDALLRDFGDQSCEELARLIADKLIDAGFDVHEVAVSEDGEHTSTYAPGAIA